MKTLDRLSYVLNSLDKSLENPRQTTTGFWVAFVSMKSCKNASFDAKYLLERKLKSRFGKREKYLSTGKINKIDNSPYSQSHAPLLNK